MSFTLLDGVRLNRGKRSSMEAGPNHFGATRVIYVTPNYEYPEGPWWLCDICGDLTCSPRTHAGYHDAAPKAAAK